MQRFIFSRSFRLFHTQCYRASQFIEPTEASTLSKNKSVKFLDTRPPEEFKKNHIPGAISSFEFFSTFLHGKKDIHEFLQVFVDLLEKNGVKKDDHIVTYESNASTIYSMSCRAYYILKLLGHENVQVLHGGIENWSLALPLSSLSASPSTPSPYTPKKDFASLKCYPDILKTIQTKNSILLDVRNPDEWVGESSSPYGKDYCPRKGRLEGAKFIWWKEFMCEGQDGIWRVKKTEEIKEICQKNGLKENDDITVYCFKGARSSFAKICLEDAGFKNITNYLGSWHEWSQRFELPIDDRKL